MTPSPLLSLFPHVFHGAADVLYLVFSVLSALVVRRSRWRVHLRWLVPFVIGDVLTVLHRTLINVHYFLGVRYNLAAESLVETTLYMANIVGLFGMFRLWQTLKGMDVGDTELGAVKHPREGVCRRPRLMRLDQLGLWCTKMCTLKKATLLDLDFLAAVDREDEGCTSSADDWGPEEVAEHRAKIAAFVHDEDKAAWVCQDTTNGRSVALILFRYRDRLHEESEPWSVFGQLDTGLFPPDGAFCEIFQLWVAPEYRRRGLASRLKRQAEAESLGRGVGLIYTHTEERNAHVIDMNLKLGYHEVRRGPIWDDVVRVSLIKALGQHGTRL